MSFLGFFDGPPVSDIADCRVCDSLLLFIFLGSDCRYGSGIKAIRDVLET
jgi:hypothetical protein